MCMHVTIHALRVMDDSPIILHSHIDDVICGVVLTSVTFMGFEGDRFATICLQLVSPMPVDASAQLITVNGVGTAAGMKNNNYQCFPLTYFRVMGPIIIIIMPSVPIFL